MSAIRESIESTIKKIKLKKRKCRFARCSKVSFDCKFEGNNFIDRYAKIVSSSLGYATYVGHNSSIEGCNVGRYTCIGPNVRIIHGNHPVHEFVSIHPAFFSLQKQAGYTDNIYIPPVLGWQGYFSPACFKMEFSVPFGNSFE